MINNYLIRLQIFFFENDVNLFYFFVKFFLSERRYFTANFMNMYVILIDRKSNEKQLHKCPIILLSISDYN